MIQTIFENEIDDWFENVKKETIKQSTYHVYHYRIKKYINPFFSVIKIEDIDDDTIRSFIKSLKNSKTKDSLAPQTVKGIINLLNEFFKHQIKLCNIKINPCDGVVLPRINTSKIKVLNDKEKNQLIQHLLQENSSRSKLVLMGLFTGMRIGELCALTWDNVDLKSNKVIVSATNQRVQSSAKKNKTMVIMGSPKTRSSNREIPISRFIVKIVKQLYAIRTSISNYVFCKKDGTGYDVRGIQKYFDKIIHQLGISKKNFHCIRHTFATQAIEAGVDVKTLSMILGHSSVITTLNLYVHPNEKHIRNRVEKVSQYLCKNI